MPTPSPWLAPRVSPGISTISTVAGTIFSVGWNFSSWYSRGSGTCTTPTLDLLEVKAKLEVSTLVLDMQLKRVDLPTLATPIIPHFSAIA